MKTLIALLLAAISALSQATVVPIDKNEDGKFTAFLDQKNSLLWTNGKIFDKWGLNYTKANLAIDGLNTSSFEGISTWRLPTIAEFTSLYNTQGNNGGKMNNAPLEWHFLYYWTSDQDKDKGKNEHLAFGFEKAGQIESYADYKSLNVWAVSPVPEPETYAMLLSGLGMIGYAARRRRAKQI